MDFGKFVGIFFLFFDFEKYARNRRPILLFPFVKNNNMKFYETIYADIKKGVLINFTYKISKV